MSSLRRNLIKLIWPHLSSDDLLLLLNEELSLARRYDAEKHLATCHRCHTIFERLQLGAQAMDAHCDDRMATLFPYGIDGHEQRMLLRLDQFLSKEEHTALLAQTKKENFRIPLPTMNPTLATALIFGFASIVFVLMWFQQKKPDITSNALLVNAEAWDAVSSQAVAGVIRQRIGIATSKRRIYRTVYRDTQGHRKPRTEVLASDDEKLKNTLVSAGVNWDAPLSATSYQEWHDRQRVRRDDIQPSGNNLILTTHVPDGLIEEQQFTVRKADFHPIERRVVLRDSEQIEIAELEYQVLPWTEIDASLFEAPGTLPSIAPGRPSLALVPRLPALPTDMQLAEAELSARLALNQLHADIGQQIQIESNPQGVQIKGLVETDARKAELQTHLKTIPHVSVSLFSIEELNRRPAPANEAVSQVGSGKGESSPLEIYFESKGLNPAKTSDLAEQLMDNALLVDQESRAIADLVARFGSGERISEVASATLTELIFSHRERMMDALVEEQQLLAKTGVMPKGNTVGMSFGKNATLVSAAERNLTLCKELTVGGGSPARNADEIIADLTASLDELRTKFRETRVMPLKAAAAAGTK